MICQVPTKEVIQTMTEQLNLRIDKQLLREFEELAEYESLDRAALVKKVLVQGLARERLEYAIQKYILQEISVGRAAEIARVSLHEFLAVLESLGVGTAVPREHVENLEPL